MNLARIVTGVLLLFVLFTAPSTGEITSVKIRSDNRRFIFFENFGFTETGHVSIAISSVSVTSVPVTSNLSQPNPSRIGFYLFSNVVREYMNHEDIPCDLDSKYISLLFTFQDLSPPSQSSFNKSHSVTFPSDYSLYFTNCNRLSYVTMDVRTEFYNTDNGNTKDYLSAELTQLPYLYSNFSLVYLILLGFWILVCFKNKLSVNRFHLLMGVLLVMKSLSLFSAAKIHYHTKVTGNPLHDWNVMFYIFQLIKAVLLYIVMVVISDGWFLLRPFLQEKIIHKKVLMVLIPIQVLATVALIVKGESGPFIKGWVTWNSVLLAIETGCCYVIMFPTVSLICSVWETEETENDTKAARKYLAMFSMVFFGYMVIMCYGIVSMSIGLLEVTGLGFYMVMFCMFNPFVKNRYLQPNLKEPGARTMLEEFVLI
ncbi:hypothetical protein Lser_V15G19974 [Lactuca serriola]